MSAGTGGGVTLCACCWRQRERESHGENSDAVLHVISFPHLKCDVTAPLRELQRFHRSLPRTFVWSTRFTSVPRLPPVLDGSPSLRSGTVSARRPARPGMRHG